MDTAGEVLGAWDVGYEVINRIWEYGIEESSTRVQVGNELHAVARVGKGDMVAVGRHERHREVLTLLNLWCHIAVKALRRLQRILGIEGSYDVWTLNIVAVDINGAEGAFNL